MIKDQSGAAFRKGLNDTYNVCFYLCSLCEEEKGDELIFDIWTLMYHAH